jgi:hypothetical protein
MDGYLFKSLSENHDAKVCAQHNPLGTLLPGAGEHTRGCCYVRGSASRWAKECAQQKQGERFWEKN